MQDEKSKDLKEKRILQIQEEMMRFDIKDPGIQEIIKSAVKAVYAANPPRFRIRGRGEQLLGRLQKKMESEYSRQTRLMRDRANAMKELAAVQKPRQPQAEAECEAFIRNLRISFTSDSDIKFYNGPRNLDRLICYTWERKKEPKWRI